VEGKEVSKKIKNSRSLRRIKRVRKKERKNWDRK
jgi:hypothetical protein